MNSILQAFGGVGLISLIPIFGLITLVISKKRMDDYIHLLVSFAVGALLGNAFLHLLPELISETTDYKRLFMLVIGGVVLFYGVEQFLQWRHCHEQTCADHVHPVGLMSQVGDTVHNFLDGILIAGSFSISSSLGWATVFAVMIHEIPQEIADFSVLLYAKWPVSRIVLVNILSAFAAFLGLTLGFLLHTTFKGFDYSAVAITAGGFVYIACTDLIPDLHEKGGVRIRERIAQLAVMLIGITLFVLL